jgi:hypothetical protein
LSTMPPKNERQNIHEVPARNQKETGREGEGANIEGRRALKRGVGE